MQIGFCGATTNLKCYNNATLISNLKKENEFKFFANCFNKDRVNGKGNSQQNI